MKKEKGKGIVTCLSPLMAVQESYALHNWFNLPDLLCITSNGTV